MRAAVLFADGFEEVEALAPADILRRAGIETVLVSADGNEYKTGAKGVTVRCDTVINKMEPDFDCIILPGGNPGYKNLGANAEVRKTIEQYHAAGKLVAAVCGAPTVLSDMGILKNRRATCYPELLDSLDCKEAVGDKKCVMDGNILTSQAAGTALDFALGIVEALAGKSKAADIAGSIYYPYGE